MDVLESFATIKAGHRETWTFLTQVDRLEMWTSPYADLVFTAESRELNVGSDFDIALRFIPVEADHLFGKVFDPQRRTHIQ